MLAERPGAPDNGASPGNPSNNDSPIRYEDRITSHPTPRSAALLPECMDLNLAGRAAARTPEEQAASPGAGTDSDHTAGSMDAGQAKGCGLAAAPAAAGGAVCTSQDNSNHSSGGSPAQLPNGTATVPEPAAASAANGVAEAAAHKAEGEGPADASGAAAGGAAIAPAAAHAEAATTADPAAAANGMPGPSAPPPPPPAAAAAAAAAPSAEQALVQEVLQKYRARVQEHIRAARKKPDMIAYKELREELTPTLAHGHLPGIAPGMEVFGRGELAILGLHSQIIRGIDARVGEPAYAIVMSGGYKDDDDHGAELWYTGEGGQKDGKQVSDQQWTKGNLALRDSKDKGVAVRVFRGKVGAQGQRLYVYEGLYNVVEAVQEQSQDGPLVCRFKMVGVPGEHVVTSKMTYKGLAKSKWVYQPKLLAGPRRRLAAAEGAAPSGRARKRRR